MKFLSKFILYFILIIFIYAICNTLFSFHINKKENKNKINILNTGEAFSYPLEDGSVIECYAKKTSGNTKEFKEYNDYFFLKNGTLYSNTLSKQENNDKEKDTGEIQKIILLDGKTTLKIYQEETKEREKIKKRDILINLPTGRYNMLLQEKTKFGYKKITTSGYCRALKP